MDAAVAATERALRGKGVEAGTRVALALPNGAPLIVLLWALWRRGAVAVPLSTRIPPAEQLRRAHRVDCAVLVTSAPDAIPAADDADMEVHPVHAVVQFEGEGRAEAALSDDQSATILFTSGSTGAPKAALHSWGNHRYSAKGANANLPLERGDRWLLSLPLYHVGGLAILVRCALAGATVVLPPGSASLADALRRTGATHVSLVSTQLRRLLDATHGPPPTALRAVLLGGGPIPNGLLRRGVDRGWPLLTSYGSTEMASQTATTVPGAPLGALRTAGRSLPHRRLRISDGEIQVAGPTLFRGYVTEAGIEASRTEDGWYATGDRGVIDAQGRVTVLGRMDRMFVSGGENIQPEEIERILEQLKGVKQAVVVPVPDREFGRRPIAFVRQAEEEGRGDLEKALERHLPGFKIPDAFHSLPDDAVSGSMKVDRQALQKRAHKLHSSSTEQ